MADLSDLLRNQARNRDERATGIKKPAASANGSHWVVRAPLQNAAHDAEEPPPEAARFGCRHRRTPLDEFSPMMSMEGVRPLVKQKEKQRSLAKQPPTVSNAASIASLEPGAGGHTWVNGPRARTALETALERLATEIRDGRRGWATGIRQDGTTVALPSSSGAASLLSAADRQSLRLMIVGGDGWTFVMHPSMGVATLDEDPTS